MNDLLPVALTFAVMKVFERVVLPPWQGLFADFLDHLQFAYRRGRGVEDAVLHVLHNIYSHLDKPLSYIRLIFFLSSFSFFLTFLAHSIQSSFIYWQRNSWIWRLASQLYSGYSIIWLIGLLVKSGSELSNIMLINNGAPQGTVLSPFLFSLYIADWRSSQDSCPIDKFADDTGLIMNDDDSHYRQKVDRFVDWCEKNYFVMNVGKTKEMFLDFRRKKPNYKPIMVNVCWTGGQILLFRISYRQQTCLARKHRWNHQESPLSSLLS